VIEDAKVTTRLLLFAAYDLQRSNLAIEPRRDSSGYQRKLTLVVISPNTRAVNPENEIAAAKRSDHTSLVIFRRI
jgi:hypothetical protein